MPYAKRVDRLLHRWLHRPYRLHTIDHGGQGPVIVLLHGLASSSANWDHLIPLLKDSYRCVTIDLLGFGESPKPQWAGYTMDDHLRAIHVTIRHLHLKTSYTLVGHSLGSLLATRYTRMHNRQVKRLVLLSPPVYAPLYTIQSRTARQRTSMYLKAYKYLRSSKRSTPENIARLRRILPQVRFLELNQDTWVPFVRSLERCIESQTLIDDIRHVAAPTDVFFGNMDEVIVPYNVKQLAKIRAVNLYPLNVHHAVTKRYAAAIARVVRHQPATKG